MLHRDWRGHSVVRSLSHHEWSVYRTRCQRNAQRKFWRIERNDNFTFYCPNRSAPRLSLFAKLAPTFRTAVLLPLTSKRPCAAFSSLISLRFTGKCCSALSPRARVRHECVRVGTGQPLRRRVFQPSLRDSGEHAERLAVKTEQHR